MLSLQFMPNLWGILISSVTGGQGAKEMTYPKEQQEKRLRACDVKMGQETKISFLKMGGQAGELGS